MNILVVDDHPDTADAISVLLTMRGHLVRTAYCGLDAVLIAREFCPHLAFVDLELPDLCGAEVARALRVYGARGPTRLRLIALSGRRLRADEHDFDLHMLKPVAARELFACCDGPRLAPGTGQPWFTTS